MRGRFLRGFVVVAAVLTLGAAPAPAGADATSDITALVPSASVELSPPVVCGAVTVYDQEDLSTLCSPTTLAATPIVSPTCPQVVSGSVRLEVDLLCTDTDGLIVGSDNTVIDLNGHRIICTGAGYLGSCQGGADDDGVDTNNFDNVHVYSNEPAASSDTPPAGTIRGFDVGVNVRGMSGNVKVKNITINGPKSPAGPGNVGNLRPATQGILVTGNKCEDGHVRLGGGNATGNWVSDHADGIVLVGASCVFIGYNRIFENSSDPVICQGIELSNSANNHLRSNFVTRNGERLAGDAGIAISGSLSTSNLLTENMVNENFGEGIVLRGGASGNKIVNNQMLFDTGFDAADSGVNEWNENNRCIDQIGTVPPGTCSPDDVPPPQ